MRDYYLTPEVSRLLSVTEAGLSNWRRHPRNYGPPCVRRGKAYHYPKNAFHDYLERLTGGDPVSPNLSMNERRKLFARLHRDETPLEDGPSRAELERRLEVIEVACGIPHALKGEYTQAAGPGLDVYSMRQPPGVVAGITPFNFPARIPMWMFGVAIAVGNTFVLQPSQRDPSGTGRLAELSRGRAPARWGAMRAECAPGG